MFRSGLFCISVYNDDYNRAEGRAPEGVPRSDLGTKYDGRPAAKSSEGWKSRRSRPSLPTNTEAREAAALLRLTTHLL